MLNSNSDEIDKFSRLAHRWWDIRGEFQALHRINPLRVEWMLRYLDLEGKAVLDVGCGGGILSESLAERGANVLGIDLSDPLIEAARLHSRQNAKKAAYRKISVEALAAEAPAGFDAIVCMEMLEHVPHPDRIVCACAQLIKPGGHLFFSTINRSLKARLCVILGAEHLFNILPVGTHDFDRFIRPSELMRMIRKSGLAFDEALGLTYNPLTQTARLSQETGMNYLLHATRPDSASA